MAVKINFEQEEKSQKIPNSIKVKKVKQKAEH